MAQKEMENYIIELDRKLFEEEKQKRQDKEDIFKRHVKEIFAKEEKPKRLRNKMESANVETERAFENQKWHESHIRIQEKLKLEKKRMHDTKAKMWHDLGQQTKMKNKAIQKQRMDDVNFISSRRKTMK